MQFSLREEGEGEGEGDVGCLINFKRGGGVLLIVTSSMVAAVCCEHNTLHCSTGGIFIAIGWLLLM